jgi:hypothetical protein
MSVVLPTGISQGQMYQTNVSWDFLMPSALWRPAKLTTFSRVNRFTKRSLTPMSLIRLPMIRALPASNTRPSWAGCSTPTRGIWPPIARKNSGRIRFPPPRRRSPMRLLMARNSAMLHGARSSAKESVRCQMLVVDSVAMLARERCAWVIYFDITGVIKALSTVHPLWQRL